MLSGETLNVCQCVLFPPEKSLYVSKDIIYKIHGDGFLISYIELRWTPATNCKSSDVGSP